MKFENTEVFNFQGAFRGMRNPMSSWDKSDSGEECEEHFGYSLCKYIIGKNDLELAQRLIKAGSEHRKFLRQIFVSVDITAPLFFFKEMDTYKVGTVANSTSTMHKLASTPITKECFEMDDYETELRKINLPLIWSGLIFNLETLRKLYNETKDKRYWKELIRLLPESWLQGPQGNQSLASLAQGGRAGLGFKYPMPGGRSTWNCCGCTRKGTSLFII